MSEDIVVVSHRSPTFQPAGWYGYRVVQADQAKDVRGLEEIAARVLFGGMPPNTPVFFAYKRGEAPYPDVCIAVPTDHDTIQAMQRGDRSAALDLLDALQEAYEGFEKQVKRGKLS